MPNVLNRRSRTCLEVCTSILHTEDEVLNAGCLIKHSGNVEGAAHQHYSVARTTGGPRDILSADRLVRRTIGIITYFGCNWAFGIPQSGLLKTREIVKGLPFFDTTYCRYGFAYRKTTRLWTNLALSLREPCTLRKPCASMIDKRHPMTTEQGRRGSDASDANNSCSQHELCKIPDGWCDAIGEGANRAVGENDAAELHEGVDVPAPATFVTVEL